MRRFFRSGFSVTVAVVSTVMVFGSFVSGDTAKAQFQVPTAVTIDVTIHSPAGYVPKWGVGQPSGVQHLARKLNPGETAEDFLVFGFTAYRINIWFGEAPHLPPPGWTAPELTCESTHERTVVVEDAPHNYSDGWVEVDINGLPAFYSNGAENSPGWAMNVENGEHLTCTVHAERLMRELTIEAHLTQQTNFPPFGELVVPITTADVPALTGLPPEARLLSEEFVVMHEGRALNIWNYEVPVAWEGTVEQTPKAGWFPSISGATSCAIGTENVQDAQRAEAQELTEPDCLFWNLRHPVLVKKYYVGLRREPTAGDVPTFTVPAGSALIQHTGPQLVEPLIWLQTFVAFLPPGTDPHEIAETVPTGWIQPWAGPGCILVDFGLDECAFSNVGLGKVRFEKWEDVNRNGLLDEGDAPVPGATALFGWVSGNYWNTEFVETSADGSWLSGDIYGGSEARIEEIVAPGWVFVASDVDGVWNDQPLRETIVPSFEVSVVRYLNRRALVDVTASKTIFNSANPSGGNGGAGWQFTLSGCGVDPLQGTTDESGTFTWSELPAAVDCEYTVAETQKSGWVADNLTRTAAPIEDGSNTTLSFVNRQIEGCFNIAQCGPVVTQSSPTPTATVVEPSPTSSPEPTATTFVPEETVAGEATPGPGANPTPIAPSTGGSTSSTSAGLSLLAILGTIALASGGTILLAARRR